MRGKRGESEADAPIGYAAVNTLDVTSLSVRGLLIKPYSQKPLQVCNPRHIDMKPVMPAP